jgi:hypothetical protein
MHTIPPLPARDARRGGKLRFANRQAEMPHGRVEKRKAST